MHEITAGHRSPSGTNSCVTGRIRFLPVTMTGSFSNFNSISYTEDRHELRVTGTRYRLPDTMSGTDEIFISGADVGKSLQHFYSWKAHPIKFTAKICTETRAYKIRLELEYATIKSQIKIPNK